MGMIRFAMSGNYKRFYNNLKELSKTNKKNPKLMFLDASISVLLTGSGLSDYLNFKFYEKKLKERKNYITIGYQNKFYKKAAFDEKKQFENKLNFLNRFKEYTKRDFYNFQDGIDTLKEFVKKHDPFMVKPIRGLGGHGVHKSSLKDYKNVEELYDLLKNENLYLEEVIVQDKEWGKISPKSINTLRVVSTNVKGKIEVISVIARIGNGVNIADNFHQGGVGVAVDLESGTLAGNALNKDLEEFEYHETSNIKFDQYKIPKLNEALELCKRAAAEIEEMVIVGWDVAFSDKGPLIIEGNNGPGWDLAQVVLKKGNKYILEDVKKQMKKAKIW